MPHPLSARKTEVNATSYPAAVDAITITDKARRLHNLAIEIENRSALIMSRLVPPVPAEAVIGAMPEPDHLVFVLEAVEESMRRALNHLDASASSL